MGVRGLTSYISDNSNLYLKPYELCDCYLIVDGNNISCHLYKWVAKSHSAFGGDYDEYYETVRGFFAMLKKCDVTPIVLFDGGYEKKKISTTLSRANDRLPILRLFAKGFSPAKFYPLFTKQTFCDVMEELGILCVQCDLEADVEIAAIARSLNCPVLSYDSDFYIFDVLYIPFCSICTTPVKFVDSNKYYVKCLIYDVTNLLNKFDGLDISMLPLIATLLGNDYIKSGIFEKFFNHVILPKNKNLSLTQRRIHGVLHWLKKENVESAIKHILSHTESKNAKKVIKAINSSIDDYTNAAVSESVIEKLKSQLGDISLNKKPLLLKLPPEISDLYYNCRIHKFIVDMITLRTYFTFQQVEHVHQESSHCPCLQLISDIYTILTPYLQGNFKPLKLYLTVRNQYQAVTLKSSVPNYIKNITIDDMLKEPERIRLKWLCCILGFDKNDLEIVPKSNWSVFILSFIFWIKKLNSFISLAHIHALILMAIANEVIQKRVGYYKSYSKFMKRKGNLFAKSKTEPLTVGDGKDFTEMLENVTMYEMLHLQSVLIPFRQTTEKATGKAYCISTVHVFGAFQSCLYHIMQLNALLNYPLPHLKISNFYSGTLLFNFFISVKSKTEVERFGSNLFKDAPNLKTLYTYLYESLCDYSEKTAVVVDPPNRKRKNRKKKSSKKTAEFSEGETSTNDFGADGDNCESDEYDDKNNPYAVLQYDVKCKK